MGCTGIDVDTAGNVYAAAVTENLISPWNPGGTLLARYGTPGTAPGQLRAPYDVAVRSGLVYVSESGNNRVSVFDSSLGLQGTFGRRRTGPGQLMTPRALDVDTAGHVYVMDSQNDCVQVFSPAS